MSEAERLKRLVFDLGDIFAAKELVIENKRKKVLSEDEADVLGDLATMESGGMYRIHFTVPDLDPYSSSHEEEIMVTDENMSDTIKSLMRRANGFEYLLVIELNPNPSAAGMHQ